MSIPAFTAAPVIVQQRPTPARPPLRRSSANTNSPDHLSFQSSENNNCNTPPEATIASWTSSIAHHCKNGRLSNAVSQFSRMRASEVEPNYVTFVTLFSGCAHFLSQGLLLGPSVHGYARKFGLDVEDVMVGTAIIDMYSKFGQMGFARLCFDHMGMKNKVSWNTLINGYMRNGEFEEAIKVFDEMPHRDAVSWTVLIDGFVKKKKFEEALVWFQDMQLSETAPDFVTIVSVLSAVANLGTLGLGIWLHRFILRHEFKDNIRVNNSLIDMYCRCGCVDMARQVFDNMPKRSLVSWNSIIVGLACNAHGEEALNYFHLMQSDGFKPDAVSFTGALTACSHAGLVDKGINLFETMIQVHKINPRIEHYGCVVDLYSRSGRLKEALMVVEKMPVKPNEVVIGSLLAACRSSKDVDLAERLMSYLKDLDPKGDSNYVLLSNIYAARGSWTGASNVRKTMKDRGVRKRPGISSIEVNGIVHEFVAGDKSHNDAEAVYMMLKNVSHELSVSVAALEIELQNEYECS